MWYPNSLIKDLDALEYVAKERLFEEETEDLALDEMDEMDDMIDVTDDTDEDMADGDNPVAEVDEVNDAARSTSALKTTPNIDRLLLPCRRNFSAYAGPRHRNTSSTFKSLRLWFILSSYTSPKRLLEFWSCAGE